LCLILVTSGVVVAQLNELQMCLLDLTTCTKDLEEASRIEVEEERVPIPVPVPEVSDCRCEPGFEELANFSSGKFEEVAEWLSAIKDEQILVFNGVEHQRGEMRQGFDSVEYSLERIFKSTNEMDNFRGDTVALLMNLTSSCYEYQRLEVKLTSILEDLTECEFKRAQGCEMFLNGLSFADHNCSDIGKSLDRLETLISVEERTREFPYMIIILFTLAIETTILIMIGFCCLQAGITKLCVKKRTSGDDQGE